MSAKDIMVSNIEKLLDRDERLNIIAMKSNNLNQHSKNIHYIVNLCSKYLGCINKETRKVKKYENDDDDCWRYSNILNNYFYYGLLINVYNKNY